MEDNKPKNVRGTAKRSAVCLLGSPRIGNSHYLAGNLLNQLQNRSWHVHRHTLTDMTFTGCRNLFHCKSGSTTCGLSDDFSPVLEDIRQCDTLILASPVYFTDVTSDLKAAIERMFSFFVPDYPTAESKSRLAAGKSLVFILTQGEGEHTYTDLMPRYWKSFSMLGFKEMHQVHVADVREVDAAENKEKSLRRVEEVAALL